MSETTEAVARAQIAVYRRLDGSARLKLAFEMSALARDLAATRLRREHPDWSADRLNRELLRYSLPACALASAARMPWSCHHPALHAADFTSPAAGGCCFSADVDDSGARPPPP